MVDFKLELSNLIDLNQLGQVAMDLFGKKKLLMEL
jgi:hypothetical protein